MPHKPRNRPGRGAREKSRSAKMRLFLEGVRRYGVLGGGLGVSGVARATIRDWLQKYPNFAAGFQDALDDHRDGIEIKLVQDIEKGNSIALRFKARGEFPEKYGERARPKSGPEKEKSETIDKNEEIEDRWLAYELQPSLLLDDRHGSQLLRDQQDRMPSAFADSRGPSDPESHRASEPPASSLFSNEGGAEASPGRQSDAFGNPPPGLS